MKAPILARCAAVLVSIGIVGIVALPGTALASTWIMGQGNGDSGRAVMSADANWIAFDSSASDLVTNDTNGASDVFMRDLNTGDLRIVSVSTAGVAGNGDSRASAISSDGRYVVFESNATNLVDGDANDSRDIFMHDCQTGTTVRVSVDSAGAQANGDSSQVSISADGRFVAFESGASNLVSGDTNDASDIFVRDTVSGTTSRVSVRTGGTQANTDSFGSQISADGHFVAFGSYASNLVSGDTNTRMDVFVRDLTANTTSRVSVDSAEKQYPKNSSAQPSISGDGRYVVFQSSTTGASDGQYDVYLRDRAAGTTSRISGDSFGIKGTADSFYPSISSNGQVVAYFSFATNLVPGDTNKVSDVFTYDRVTGVTRRASVDTNGLQMDGDAQVRVTSPMSADGRYLAFQAAWDASDNWTGTDGIFLVDISGLPAQHLVSAPVAPTTMSHTKSYTVFGYLKPRHTAGTSPVRIYLYKKNSKGAWIGKGYVTAKASNYSSYTKYSKSVKLSSAGKWRLRAYAPADGNHAAMWSSGYDYVTVK